MALTCLQISRTPCCSSSSRGASLGHGKARTPMLLPGSCFSSRKHSFRCYASDSQPLESGSNATSVGVETDSMADFNYLPDNFCIIESRDSVRNFSTLQVEEVEEHIQARKNRIFLLMEEVRRLRIQQRLKGSEATKDAVREEPFPSVVPFFPPVTDKTVQKYQQFYWIAVGAIIVFGGLLSPILEVRLGLGGTSYREFISQVHLPAQLADVDPIVASFCGGAVGVLSATLVVESNNAKTQAKGRCMYCEGTGYLTCGNCTGSGVVTPFPTTVGAAANGGNGARVGGWKNVLSQDAGAGCPSCSGTGKVMCTSCFCTGKALATEHDPRMDPFG